jgi:hypothetical protein
LLSEYSILVKGYTWKLIPPATTIISTYRIYIPGQRQIEINRDVTFDEDEAFKRSKESHMDEDREEQEALRDAVMVDSTLEEPISEVQNEMVESERFVDPPREAAVTRKRLAWLRNTLQEAEGHATPKGSFRESKKPHKFSSYVVLMSRIIDSEPSKKLLRSRNGRMA